MIRYSNPMFSNVETTNSYVSTDTATYKGVTLKTLLLLGIAGIAGILSGLLLYKSENLGLYAALLIISSIVGIITIIIGRTNAKASAVCGIIYSACEGLFLGSITLIADLYYQGIAVIAVASTAVIFAVCLAIFACGAMRNTSTLRNILVLTLCSIVGVSLVLLILNLFNIDGTSKIISNNLGLIIFIEILYILYGVVMLFMNFNEATSYVQNGATKDFEWMAAFGLLVSILYIYLEVLRVLLYIFANSRRD